MSKSKQKASVRAGSKPANKTHPPASDKARKAAADEIAQRIERLEGGEASAATAATKAATTAHDAAAEKPAGGKRGTKAKAAKGQPNPASAKPAKAKKVSGLDAAAMVLAESASPMKAVDLLAEITKRGLWTSKGKTPEATLYAAIIREIAAKGSASRFRKHDRGLFVAGQTASGEGA